MSTIWSRLINLAGNITGVLPVVNGGSGVTVSTGTVANVLSTSPTLVTPVLGVATATSVAFSPTTSGLIGTATNNDAAAGIVGEYYEVKNATIAAGTSGQYFDVLDTAALGAGDFDVTGKIEFLANGATFTSTGFVIGLSGSAGNSSTGLTDGQTDFDWTGVIPTTFNRFGMEISTRVQSDGTNLYINGTTFASTQVLHLKGLVSVYSVGAPKLNAKIMLRRVR